MRRFIAAAGLAALAFAGAANAEFFPGQLVTINGVAGPQFGGTSWGTNDGQGQHGLGGSSTYWDANFGSPDVLQVFVDSEFLAPNIISFTFDFGQFFPADFSNHEIHILGLKQDSSIVGVTASQGQIVHNGNDVTWFGTGAGLGDNPDLKITVEQIPAPGALALLGVAGLVARRRRA